MPIPKKPARPAFAIEKEAVKEEIQTGLHIGVEKLSNLNSRTELPNHFHNTKYLLKQYRRVSYAVNLSETELNLRMELDHSTQLSTLELNAELAGIDLSNTKLESYAQSVIRSKNMLEIIHAALDGVKLDPEHGELYFQVLYQTYFTKTKPRNREQIIRELDRLGYPMSPASYHNYLNAAINAMDRILWGYTARDCIGIIKEFLPDTTA
ncbi:hypothetical protein [Oscillibacter sp. MSJ-31]|uniref:hypothetical protein n=1 Tax=Oscillibacter sp. MSJ-31 TaxID=2841526 RepID=UPI001C11C03E|nr:hypothetical protein [Oscillibacter sp. MSJ-31]MBU5456698.1 hypothetical protein [Oscillibacter sp. MSJ-31]